MIEVNERIEVSASPRVVWGILSDPRTVVECVEGAELGEQQEDGSYDATLVVKFGPARVSFKAKVAVEYDAATMTGSVLARGKDGIGGTRVQSTMKFSVTGQDNPPSVHGADHRRSRDLGQARLADRDRRQPRDQAHGRGFHGKADGALRGRRRGCGRGRGQQVT